MAKIHFGIFGEDQNYPASILGNLAFKQGWDVDIHCYPYNTTDEEIETVLMQSKPDLVALSFMLSTRSLSFKVANIAKSNGIKVFAGGVHPSTCPDDLVKSNLFDAVVIGDGMGIFEDMLGSYNNFNGKIVEGRRHPDISLYVQRYFSEKQKLIIKQSKTLRTFSNFGCPYDCYFCASMFKFTKLPIPLVVDQLEKVKSEFGVERIIFYDDTFAMEAQRLKEFRRLLKQRDISFIYQTPFARVDTFTDSVAQELRLIGVEELMFGVETASERLLKFINKRVTQADIYRASELCRKYNLHFRISLMIGIPTQNKQDYEETLEFVKQTLPDEVRIHLFTPFPKTYLYDYCIKNGHMPEGFNFDSYLGFDPMSKGFRGFGEKAMLRDVDYEMAFRYKTEIENVVDSQKMKLITETLKKIDSNKWVLFGTGEYFYEVLKKADSLNLKNCLGYCDYDGSGFKGLSFYCNIPRYVFSKNNVTPDVVIVTVHKEGKAFNHLIAPMIRRDLSFSGEIISVSSYNT